MACQALNSFTEILFSEDNRQEDDADIENLRRQMDMYDVDDDIDDDIDDDDIDEDNNDASPAVTNTTNNKNVDVPTELTIKVPLQENQNHSHSHSQASEEAILACRSADAVDDIVEDANGNGNKADTCKAAEEKKIASVTGTDADGADAGTVETSPLDVTQDNSDSSLTGTSANSSSSNGSDDNASKSKSKSNKNKNTTTVGRSRSHLSSLHHLKANLYSKANQLRELDTLVSWQSRRTCKLSDPTVSANYDESVEVTAVNVTMAANRRGEDPPEQLEEVDNKEGMNEDELAVSDLEPSPEQQAWSANYAKLADQYRQHGGSIAHITHSRTAKPNVEYDKLRMFIDQQRNAARRGMLSKEQIVQLVAVGMDFGDIEEANIGDDNKGGNTGDTTKPAAFDDDNDMTKQQQQQQQQQDEEETDGTMKEISQCASF